MPKCKLKPWKYFEPQPIFVSKNGKRRLSVLFYKDDEKDWRVVYYEKLMENKWCRMDVSDELFFADWIGDILRYLGIPETIEVSNEPN